MFDLSLRLIGLPCEGVILTFGKDYSFHGNYSVNFLAVGENICCFFWTKI